MSLNDDLRRIFRLLAQLDRPRSDHAGDKPNLDVSAPLGPARSEEEPHEPELRFRPLASARAGPAGKHCAVGAIDPRDEPQNGATAAFAAAAERIVRRYLRRPARGRRKSVRGGLARAAAAELAREAERIFGGDRPGTPG